MKSKVVAVLAVAALAGGFAAPALAQQPRIGKDSFPPASDISASLGKYKTAPDVTSEKYSSTWFVCANVEAKAQERLSTAQYETSPPTQSLVKAEARTYASAGKAKAAFADIQARLKKCNGSAVEESEPGSGMKWKVTTTSGEIASLMSSGQPSLFTYERQTPTKNSTATAKMLGTGYQVLTLAGDTILITDINVSGKSSMSAGQRDAVVSFATDFLGTWTAAND